ELRKNVFGPQLRLLFRGKGVEVDEVVKRLQASRDKHVARFLRRAVVRVVVLIERGHVKRGRTVGRVLPSTFLFATQLPVRITDLNYGAHLGNDALLSILHEARVQVLAHLGTAEVDHTTKLGFIMADVAVEYKAEAFYGDVLHIEIGAADLSKYGFDLVYLVKNQSGREVARAKTAMSTPFQLMLLTAPTAQPDEAHVLTELLAQDLGRLHLRKPSWTAAQLETLIQALPPQVYPRLVLHAYPELVRQYQLGGLHLTERARAAARRRPALLPGQTLSTSFHSLAEISRGRRHYDYVFLSPIFDSISKEGYASNFDLGDLRRFFQAQAARPGHRPPVLALGGIEAQNISHVRQAGFAGAAVLGAVWQSTEPVAAWQQITQASAASQSFHTAS
nr:hypothetical protein [Tanacetum cinerariifolium]